ncbi:MAG: CRISPR-associated endonuclease Cas2 [Thermoplasmata archaeon]|nr:MAG: CRISPR-associated endonuclease Cas2 [Thermoplasmata archaeon]RLF70613.1 MAG: CRISPR-associated endonuclease Cas2 [Thermoplasmata archaeon]
MLTLIIYDISEDKPRKKLSDYLLDRGLFRVQYSSFVGDLNYHDRKVMEAEMKKFLTSEQDSVIIVPICKNCFRQHKILSNVEKRLVHTDEVEFA